MSLQLYPTYYIIALHLTLVLENQYLYTFSPFFRHPLTLQDCVEQSI